MGYSSRPGSKFVFIDGFSGIGSFADGSDGSPLMALRTIMSHPSLLKINTQIELIFVEMKKSTANTLKEKLDRARQSFDDNVASKGNGKFVVKRKTQLS
jgi:hypothetical protein